MDPPIASLTWQQQCKFQYIITCPRKLAVYMECNGKFLDQSANAEYTREAICTYKCLVLQYIQKGVLVFLNNVICKKSIQELNMLLQVESQNMKSI